MKVRIPHLNAMLLCSALCLGALSLQAAIRYVKPVAVGLGNGSSWTNASADLQLMINSSGTNDELWVAMGTYNPIRRADALGSITIGDRNNAFVLKADVKVYGGFAGNELSLSLRNYITNVTILSGDIGVLNDNTDNCYHVVISSGPVNAATLDGFTITKGYGITGGGITVNLNVVGNFVGGGIHNFFSSPTIANCSFISNKASDGGGMNNFFSSPSIINCIFSVNDANEGGGIYNQNSSSPQITNCSITLNTASLGGGISNRSASTPVMNRVLFSGNTASSGGAVLNLLGSNSVFNNCGLFGNRAVSGGSCL